MTKHKRITLYGTIQMREVIREQIVDFCNRNDLRIGRYIERLFLAHVSGSTSGSLPLPKS